MQFSLKTLLLVFFAFSVSLALTQVEFLKGSYLLIGEIALLAILLSKARWRAVAYGAIAGIIIMMVLMSAYVGIYLGLGRPTNYQESAAIGAISDAWRPYIIQMGAFFGALLGLIIQERKFKR